MVFPLMTQDLALQLEHLKGDHIESWHVALGYTASTGFRSDPFHNQIHADHLHLSFETEMGTENQE